MNKYSGFVAFPSSPAEIGNTINAALDSLEQGSSEIELTAWPNHDIAGRFLVDPILHNIGDFDVTIADITRLNFNVTFEIGHAIGRQKRLILIQNRTLNNANDMLRDVGIFDTLGYKQYATSGDLVEILRGVGDIQPLPLNNPSQGNEPVYVILPRVQSDLEIRLVSRLKKTRLHYKTFDGAEIPRLSARDAIDYVSQSYGVVIPLLSSERVGYESHNQRAAFVAGLATGMDKELLMLQSGEDPVPLDYRDLVKHMQTLDQLDGYISDFAAEVVARMQPARGTKAGIAPKTFLEKLNLGASFAENELYDLANYYLETEEFRRALRGEVRIVTGRKGVGKTALFAQLVNKLRQDRKKVVVDLRPEGFQLIKFRERVLDFMEDGTKEHTITAFWEYVLLLECCHKLIKNDEVFHMRDSQLFDAYRRLADTYEADEFVSEGDFSERMIKLTSRIEENFVINSSEPKHLTNAQITELIHKHDIPKLRDEVTKYLKKKNGLWLLIDNLDKGWPPHGVQKGDVLVLRCLIDAMGKLERELRKNEIDAHGLVFIRNDVFGLLVAETPDRGKWASVALDWSDPEMMRELLRKRFLYTDAEIEQRDFIDIWRQIAAPIIDGEETSQYLIERSLMRPRALIDLVRACRSHAVNLGNDKIELEDIRQGEEEYSNGLLVEMSYEIQDVIPEAYDVLYEFIEAEEVLSDSDLRKILSRKVGQENVDRFVSVLLGYGFLGIIRNEEETSYIYSVRYDARRLEAIRGRLSPDRISYRINPAFWKVLEVKRT